MEIQEIRKQTGMSQSEFARHFDIPLGSLQNWEHNYRKPPEYLIKMIIRLLEYEGRLRN